MRVREGFRTFVLDQLSDVRGLLARAMFGGVGLYSDGMFFGIIASDVLYFKVDVRTRRHYEAKGMRPFSPYGGQPGATASYYAVPLDVLEDAEDLATWAARAIDVAARSKSVNG